MARWKARSETDARVQTLAGNLPNPAPETILCAWELFRPQVLFKRHPCIPVDCLWQTFLYWRPSL